MPAALVRLLSPLVHPRGCLRTIAALLIMLCAACSPLQSQPQAAPTDPPMTQPAPAPGAPDQATATPGSPLQPDRHCSVDADCQVKNVGSCCGIQPSCVNKDAAVDPEAVKAACAKSGTASICGFRPVEACSCTQGQCTNIHTMFNGGGQPVSQ